jgi:hypothetical protein
VGAVGFVLPVAFTASAYALEHRRSTASHAERPVSPLRLHAGTQFDATPPPHGSDPWQASGSALYAEPRCCPTLPVGCMPGVYDGSRLMDEDWDEPFTVDPPSPPPGQVILLTTRVWVLAAPEEQGA